MAPKQIETHLSEDRMAEINNMLESHGIEHATTQGLEFLDRALTSGWKIPTVHKIQQQQLASNKEAPKKLVTTAVHMARDYLGEPVGARKKQDA